MDCEIAHSLWQRQKAHILILLSLLSPMLLHALCCFYLISSTGPREGQRMLQICQMLFIICVSPQKQNKVRLVMYYLHARTYLTCLLWSFTFRTRKPTLIGYKIHSRRTVNVRVQIMWKQLHESAI